MTAGASSAEPSYGIGAVAKLTGLTDHTIRVWERRYQAVVAGRAANGRRIYTARDVEKLSLLQRLTNRGVSIGMIANDSPEELERRLQSLGRIAGAAVPERVAVAVLGDFLPARLRVEQADLSPLELVIADSNTESLMADLACQAVDIVVLESATLDSRSVSRLRDCLGKAGTERGILVYSFGRSADVEGLRGSNIVAIRAPVTGDELRAAVLRSYSPEPHQRRRAPAASADVAVTIAEPAARRRFDRQQLAVLANISTTIDCECPRHLAQLIRDLSAFEIYSADCTDRSDEDAALHQYLHRSIAEARALVEAALQRVIDAEGIEY